MFDAMVNAGENITDIIYPNNTRPANHPTTDAEVDVIVTPSSNHTYTKLSAQEAKDMIGTRNDIIILDVREEYEFCGEGGHIPCSVNYPLDSGLLEERYTDLSLDAKYLVVCRSGNRSAAASEFLVSKGFTSVYDIGGMNDWIWETQTCSQSCKNLPPTADAGVDIIVNAGELITLNAINSSDPDDGIISYTWTQTGGIPVILSDPELPQIDIPAPEEVQNNETLVFELTVTDKGGLEDTDNVVVTINPLPIPEYTKISSLEAKNMIGTRNDLIILDVREDHEFCGESGHIPCAVNYPLDSGVLENKYSELPLDGVFLVVCRSGNRSAAAAEFLASKGFTSVYDIGGMNDWKWETLTCEQSCENLPPTADAGIDVTANEGKIVTLDATSSFDPDDGITSYFWTQTKGTFVSLSDPASPTPVFTSPSLDALESLIFELTVTDKEGLESRDDVIVNVTPLPGNNDVQEENTSITFQSDNDIQEDDSGGGGCFINNMAFLF